MYLIFSISLLGSIFYILFKILEKILKGSIKSKSYYNILKLVALTFIIPISYILSLYIPDMYTTYLPYNNKAYIEEIPEKPKNIEYNFSKTNEVVNLQIENKPKLESVPNLELDNKQKEKFTFNIHYVKKMYLIGILLFIIINLLFFVKFKLNIKKSVYILDEDYNKIFTKTKERLNIKKNILFLKNENIYSPMLVGILKPKIILPFKEFNLSDLELVLTHELIHFKRKDLITKLFLLYINALNFFNPLVYFLIKDIDKYCEYSCDENLIKIYNKNKKKDYCLAILNSLNTNKKANIYFTTTFSCKKNNLKRRLENIMLKDKPKNKLKITLISSSIIFFCTIFTITLSIFYSNNRLNVFAKEKFNIDRNFDEAFKINTGNGEIDGKQIKLDTNIIPQFEKEQNTPSIRLKGTFIKEEPSIGGMTLDFSVRKYTNKDEISIDKYSKIELENIGKHKDDKNNTFDLKCIIYGKYYNNNTRNEEKIFLGSFNVPKNKKATYVFENIPLFNGYTLEFSHKNSYASSFNITVTTGYRLEDLGVDNISNLYIEKTEPLKYTDGQRLNNVYKDNNSTYKEVNGGGKRTFELDSGFYRNLNLKFENKSKDEYCIFLYDKSKDVYNEDLFLNSSIYKEYEIKANSTFDEIITNTLCKVYELRVVPKELREDYLKLQELKEKLFKEAKEQDIYIDDVQSKTRDEYEKLGKAYYDKYEKILLRQEGSISYKFFN